ncbi:rod shape-determining protein RodA [Erythrobacter sp. 3-20A1M]|uniref:rod shape-determining protein RodA n=1 Tax=Erythrobacter sp. 3-20A1M TaxID=2653850 RepID=UPI001BFCC1C1|nr:rod shape-determining protein RodA [Erythrobacter sp. 3-20A1M]QWC55683.1 rod shape-determining protein RodA [Erythrobacter sp. 3-20A1M]
MNSIVPTPIARLPWRMLFPLVALTLFGAAVLYSAGGGHFSPYASSHLLRFGILFVVAACMTLFNRDFVRMMAYPAYGGVLLLLLAVETVGAIGGGSQRWLNIGPLVLQPSELMKPVIVLALARFYDTLPTGMINGWRALLPAAGLIGMPMLLVLAQPDLGTALAIGFGGVVIMFLAGLPMLWFAGAGIAGAIAVPLAYLFALKPYQQKRVTTFLDPESDPLGTGYHITQSKIAIGSGGFSGKGFNEGSQSHLNYLPEPHTDFVFATMAEEWGFLGGLFVLFCFAAILWWGLSVARNAEQRFDRLLAAGMVATMFFYAAINLMMVMGLAPVVGIPLPFMSHGGSSMMTNMICLGTLMMVRSWGTSGRRGALEPS